MGAGAFRLPRRGRARLRVIGTVAVLAIATVAVFMGVAFAHHPILGGDTVCTNGDHEITWTITNSESNKVMDIIVYNEVVPAVNQIEVNPFLQQEESVAFMRANGVQAEAWAPFAEGRNNLFQNETLTDIARQHGRTVGQVVLRWVVQRGIVALAKSVRKERMEENLRVFDFALDEAEMARIAQLETGQSSFFSHRDPAMVKSISERRLDI